MSFDLKISNQYENVQSLVDDIGASVVQALSIPFPSDHARTLLMIGPERGEARYVLKIARSDQADIYMERSFLLQEFVPPQFGRLNFIFPMWKGNIAGKLATIEPFVHGSKLRQSQVGDLLKEWSMFVCKHGNCLPEQNSTNTNFAELQEFSWNAKLGAGLVKLVENKWDLVFGPPAFCHGDLINQNCVAIGEKICIYDWDFARSEQFREFDTFYFLLSECMPFRTYDKARKKFSRLYGKYEIEAKSKLNSREAFDLVMLYMAFRSAKKAERNLREAPKPSPFLAMLLTEYA